MKQISLTQGKVALVDDDVYEAIGHLVWHAFKNGNVYYAKRNFKKDNGKQGAIYLHHCIVGLPLNDQMVDHIDGDGLNNQRSNLRIVTNRNNVQNRHEHRNGHLPGASFMTHHFRNKPWMSYIRINGKRKFLGYFATEKEAHERYMKALEEMHI